MSDTHSRSTAIEELRHDRAALEAEIELAGSTIQGSNCTCPHPNHDDQRPSAQIRANDQGVWRVTCYSHNCFGKGADIFDLRAAVTGKPLADVLREAKAELEQTTTRVQRKAAPSTTTTTTTKKPDKPVYPSIEAIEQSIHKIRQTYLYTNPATNLPDMVVFRCRETDGRKSFMQARPCEGGFVLEAPDKPWPIYNRTRLRQSKVVIVVEGESCVHALHEIGLIGTTSPGGAGKSEHADWSPLAGKTVYLWPDADAPDAKTGVRNGIKHMREVAKQLEMLDPAPQLFWVDCDTLGLPPKGDVVDYLDQHVDEDADGKRLAVEAVLQDAEPLGASAEVHSMLKDTISGKRKPVPWPWPSVSALTRALLPGTVTAICGDPGSSKSFLLLEAAAYWHDQGYRVALYELEEDRAYHLYRALAQRAGASQLFDDDWVQQHGDEAMYLYQQHRDFLDSFGRTIHEAPDEQVSLTELADWVERMAMAGARVIAIDPVTAAAATDKPWIEDLKFLMRVKTIVRQAEASLVLVTHPRKGSKSSSFMDDMSGGAAYPRFSQTVMWLDLHKPPEDYAVQAHGWGITQQVHANRSIKLTKTRNGKGGGYEIAMNLHGGTLRFEELGVVVDETEGTS